MIETILSTMRSTPLSFNDLEPDAQQFLRDFFQLNREFDSEQRSLIENWWLELPLEQLPELADLNLDRAFKIVPQTIGGKLLIPAATLSDPLAYGYAFGLLTSLHFVEAIPPPFQPPTDDT
jgi:hypothetical protein